MRVGNPELLHISPRIEGFALVLVITMMELSIAGVGRRGREEG